MDDLNPAPAPAAVQLQVTQAPLAAVVAELKADGRQLINDAVAAAEGAPGLGAAPGAVIGVVARDAKSMFASRTVWGGLCLTAAALLATQVPHLDDWGRAAAGVGVTGLIGLGNLLLGVGRANATQPLK